MEGTCRFYSFAVSLTTEMGEFRFHLGGKGRGPGKKRKQNHFSLLPFGVRQLAFAAFATEARGVRLWNGESRGRDETSIGDFATGRHILPGTTRKKERKSEKEGKRTDLEREQKKHEKLRKRKKASVL